MRRRPRLPRGKTIRFRHKTFSPTHLWKVSVTSSHTSKRRLIERTTSGISGTTGTRRSSRPARTRSETAYSRWRRRARYRGISRSSCHYRGNAESLSTIIKSTMVRNLNSNGVNSETANQLQPVKMQHESVTYEVSHYLSQGAHFRSSYQDLTMVEGILEKTVEVPSILVHA